jgi:hypothetical protein
MQNQQEQGQQGDHLPRDAQGVKHEPAEKSGRQRPQAKLPRPPGDRRDPSR